MIFPQSKLESFRATSGAKASEWLRFDGVLKLLKNLGLA
jgi:hypothetical protein